MQKAEDYAHHAIELIPTLAKPDTVDDATFEKAKNDKLALAHSGLGLIDIDHSKFEDARTELTQAVQLASSPDPVDYYLLGNADAQASYMNGAIAAYEKCAATGPLVNAVQGSRGCRQERRGFGNKVEQGLSRRIWLSPRSRSWSRFSAINSAIRDGFSRRLMHSSRIPERAADEPSESNEKLEFLGDAVLELMVSEELVREFPDWSEGQLSKSRARLVNATAISLSAQRLGLGKYLRLGRGEEKTGGRNKPALLADAYEALIAAIYLDGGLEAARGFVQRSLVEGAIECEAERLGHTDHKSALQEFLQSRGMAPGIVSCDCGERPGSPENVSSGGSHRRASHRDGNGKNQKRSGAVRCHRGPDTIGS